MEHKEVMSNQQLIKLLRQSRCDECPLDCMDECLLPAIAADRLEALLTEHKDERHRHDRYVDFELAEAEELRKLKEQLRWIPVAERSPKVFERVLICREKEPGQLMVEQGFLDVGDWWKVYGTRVRKITAWMPLPEPPKEDK